MSMKDQTQRWLLAAGVLGTLLAVLFFLHGGPPPAAHAIASAPPLPAAPFTAARDATAPAPARPLAPTERQSYIVQATSAGEAGSAVVRVGGTVTGDLSIIHAVSASLSDDELEALRASAPGLHVYLDAPVAASSVKGTLPETYYPSEVAAKDLQVGGVTGAGVTVAVVDSGLWSQRGPDQSAPGQTSSRVLAQYDVIAASQQPPTKQLVSASAANVSNIDDPFGHGTHVTSIIASSGVADHR